jgi:hypothetical protein
VYSLLLLLASMFLTRMQQQVLYWTSLFCVKWASTIPVKQSTKILLIGYIKCSDISDLGFSERWL